MVRVIYERSLAEPV
jgi:FixJ family two-component response regulator